MLVNTCLQFRLERINRRLGIVVHRPAGGVPAEQGALRPFQHLHPADIIIAARLHPGFGNIDFIEVGRDRGIELPLEFIQADAADVHALQESIVGVSLQVGHLRGQAVKGAPGQFPVLFVGKGRDGQPHVLDGLFAFLRGDDDLFQH